jgi:molybdate transport system substrate-binding protein
MEECAHMKKWCLMLFLIGCSKQEQRVTVLAASDLSLVLPRLAAMYEEQFHEKIDFVTGSTGQLAAQIEAGAEANVFLSADEKRVDALVKVQKCNGNTKQLFAKGVLVLISKNRINSLSDLKKPFIQFIALANPQHAPYGAAAKQALEQAGLWTELSEKFVYANSVKHAQQLAQSRNADAAFVARGNLKKEDVFYEIPLDAYAPLMQVAISCGRDNKGTRFVDFLNTPKAQAILGEHGFLPSK